MDENHIKIRVEEQSVAARARRGQRGGGPWLIVGGMVLLISAIVFLFRPRHFESTSAVFSPPNQPRAQAAVSTTSEAQLAHPKTSLAATDDGESLWASPTDGEPIVLNYLLPGTQLILHVRVADLLAHSEGEKVIAALGPWGHAAIERITSLTGVELEKIETLLLGIRPTRGGSLQFALRVRLIERVSEEELDHRLPNNKACFLPNESNGQVLVACSPPAFAELVATGENPPLFARELQRVLQRTDTTRIATLVFAGKFLQINGEKFLQGTAEPLREALVDFLGDKATATALSAHWDDNFFLELQSTVALNARPHRFAALLEQRVAASSERVEDLILSEPLHPYGRKVLARFPAMLRKVGNYARSGEDRGLSVVRTYLPVTAGHNLLMATELVLNVAASPGASGSGALGDIAVAKPPAIGDRLGEVTSLVFPKETLERALEMLSDDVGVPLEIAGRDLQLEGITKNQSFGIDLRDRPAAEILLAVLLRANPDRTASGPTDVKQKLVYIIRESEGNKPGAIVVTTRSAAGRRGEKLPLVFEPLPR